MDRTVTTVIDAERCIGCGKCIPVCPPETLAMRHGKAVVVGPESLQCGHCAAVCPTNAIRVDALDPDMLAFRTFQMDTRWLSHSAADPAGLVRLMASRRSCRTYLPDPVTRDTLEPRQEVAFDVPPGDPEMQLFAAMSEALFLQDARDLLAARVDIRGQPDGGLRVVLGCDRLDAARHAARARFKAVTLHGMAVRRSRGGLSVRVVLDA